MSFNKKVYEEEGVSEKSYNLAMDQLREMRNKYPHVPDWDLLILLLASEREATSALRTSLEDASEVA